MTSGDTIVITPAAAEAIVSHALAAAPRECCGLLVGTASRIDESVATRNVDPSPTRFRVDPEAHLALNRRLRGSGQAVVGAYHSHPYSSAEPSAADIAEAYYPDFVNVIVSLAEGSRPSLRAYRIIRGAVAQVTLERTRG